MLQANNLVLNLPHATTMAPLSFNLESGKILWVRGENGTGKSTLLKTLLGLRPPAAGDFTWLNGRPSLYYLAHDLGLVRQLTAHEYCRWHPALPQLPAQSHIHEALKAVDLLPQSFVPCAQLSRGQQQRLLIACAILSQAKLWLLDEPLTALDASSRERVLACVQAHAANGGAAIVVSHYPLHDISHEVLDVLA